MYKIDYTADFAWAVSAASDSIIDPTTNGVQIETQEDGARRLIATDHKRIHILENCRLVSTPEVPDGFYNVTFTKKKQGEPVMLKEAGCAFLGPWVSWRNGVPGAEKFTHKATLESLKTVSNIKLRQFSLLFGVFSCGIAIVPEYLTDLDKADVTEWVMYTQDKLGVVKFESGNYTAFIAPCETKPTELVKIPENGKGV